MTTSDSPPHPRLFDQIKQTCRLKHFSLKTEKSYCHYIRDYILFHNKRHPKDIGVDEIRQYFPSWNRSLDPISGEIRRHHVYPDTLQRAVKAASAVVLALPSSSQGPLSKGRVRHG
jgi:hypothetical protein